MPWVLLFLCVASLLAQEPGEKPAATLPEPKLQHPAQEKYTIAVVEYVDAVNERDIFPLAIPHLLDFFRKATDLEVEIGWSRLPLYDPRIENALMLYLTGRTGILRLGEVEKKKLGEYLRKGGLLYAEEVVPGGVESGPPTGGGIAGTPFDRQFKALMRDPLVLGDRGKYWQRLPKDHPLYSNYFDLPDGPPLSASAGGNVFALEALEYRGRIAVIFSDLNLSWYWAALDAEGRLPSLQLGVNLIVQALTYRLAGLPLPIRE